MNDIELKRELAEEIWNINAGVFDMAKSEGWRKGVGKFHKADIDEPFKPAPSWDRVTGRLQDTTHRGDMTQTDADDFKPTEPPVVRKSGLTDT